MSPLPSGAGTQVWLGKGLLKLSLRGPAFGFPVNAPQRSGLNKTGPALLAFMGFYA